MGCSRTSIYSYMPNIKLVLLSMLLFMSMISFDSDSRNTGTETRPSGTPTIPSDTSGVDSHNECAENSGMSNASLTSALTNKDIKSEAGGGPCNGRRGFRCDKCLNGWFCPPMETPAQAAPCGLGWPCYHCEGGWFCVDDEDSEIQIPQSIGGGAAPPAQYSNSDSNKYLYLGCFQGSASWSLAGSVPVDYLSGAMSTMICVNHCFERGYTFGATENGHECWCGESLRGDALQLPEESCTLPCHGHQSNMCGGKGTMSLFADPQEMPSLA